MMRCKRSNCHIKHKLHYRRILNKQIWVYFYSYLTILGLLSCCSLHRLVAAFASHFASHINLTFLFLCLKYHLLSLNIKKENKILQIFFCQFLTLTSTYFFNWSALCEHYVKHSNIKILYLTTMVLSIIVFNAIRWVGPFWPVAVVGLMSTVATAVAILAVRSAPSVLLDSSWLPSVQYTQTGSARLACVSMSFNHIQESGDKSAWQKCNIRSDQLGHQVKLSLESLCNSCWKFI